MTLEEAMQKKGKTDWARIDQEIAAGIEPELTEDEIGIEWDWSRAVMVVPQPKTTLSIRLDPDIVAFFKADGPGYQTRMNAVLRAWMDAQKARKPR